DDPSLGEDLRAHRNKPAVTAVPPDPASAAPAAEAQAPEAPLGESERRVPALLGQSARAAIVATQQADLKLALSGSGLGHSQQPPPGAVVALGSTVSVVLEPPDLGPTPAPAGQRSARAPADDTADNAPLKPAAPAARAPATRPDENEAA